MKLPYQNVLFNNMPITDLSILNHSIDKGEREERKLTFLFNDLKQEYYIEKGSTSKNTMFFLQKYDHSTNFWLKRVLGIDLFREVFIKVYSLTTDDLIEERIGTYIFPEFYNYEECRNLILEFSLHLGNKSSSKPPKFCFNNLIN